MTYVCNLFLGNFETSANWSEVENQINPRNVITTPVDSVGCGHNGCVTHYNWKPTGDGRSAGDILFPNYSHALGHPLTTAIILLHNHETMAR
jgi:hypothetical protein